MKKFIAITTALILSISCFTACGNKNKDNNDDSKETTTVYVLEESEQYKLAEKILNLLSSQGNDPSKGELLDYGKYEIVATNIEPYADTESQVNKLIKENIGEDCGKWFIYDFTPQYTDSMLKELEERKSDSGYISSFFGQIVVPSGRGGIIEMTINGTKEQNTSFDDYFEKFVSNGSFKTKIEAKSIEANALYSTYKNNEVNADNLYSNKQIIVSGKVKAVEKSSYSWDKELGLYCVEVYSSDKYNVVKCYFSDSDAVANLRSENSVYIEGECVGLSSIYPCLKNCKIIEE